MGSRRHEGIEALREIANRLERLERETEASGLNMLVLLLRQARVEAEKRLAEYESPWPSPDRQ